MRIRDLSSDVCSSDLLRVATGWRLRKPIDQWTVDDVYGASATVADDAGFRAHVEENAEHRRQLRRLGRREDRLRISTPWGMAQSSEIYADGVVFHSTASHGGIKLDRARNAAMPALRSEGRRVGKEGVRTGRSRGA